MPLTFSWAIVRCCLMDVDLIWSNVVRWITLATASLVQGLCSTAVAVLDVEVMHTRLGQRWTVGGNSHHRRRPPAIFLNRSNGLLEILVNRVLRGRTI